MTDKTWKTQKPLMAARKAELTAFVTIIVFAIVFVIMIFLVKTYLTSVNGDAQMRQCQSSLLLTRATAALTPNCLVGTPTPFALSCPRRFIEISTESDGNNGKIAGNQAAQSSIKKVEVDGKLSTSKYDATCADGTKNCLERNVAAQEMARCWKTFFNGEQIVLQNTDVKSMNVFTSKDYVNACFICSEISFTAKDDGMIDYLKTASVPSTDTTYYDYLAKNPKAWCDPDFNVLSGTCWDGIRMGTKTSYKRATSTSAIFVVLNPALAGAKIASDLFAVDSHPAINYTIDPSKKYAVVFIRRGLGTCDNVKDNDAWMQHQHMTNTVQLVPVDQLNSLCDKSVS